MNCIRWKCLGNKQHLYFHCNKDLSSEVTRSFFFLNVCYLYCIVLSWKATPEDYLLYDFFLLLCVFSYSWQSSITMMKLLQWCIVYYHAIKNNYHLTAVSCLIVMPSINIFCTCVLTLFQNCYLLILCKNVCQLETWIRLYSVATVASVSLPRFYKCTVFYQLTQNDTDTVQLKATVSSWYQEQLWNQK